MTLPKAIAEFWYAMAELNEEAERTRWGFVASDSRFPLVWDANYAAIMEETPDLTLDEVRAALVPAIRRSRAAFEHIEVWDVSPRTPAVEEVRRLPQRHGRDAVMVFEGEEPTALPMQVKEITEPAEWFWDWYRRSRGEFEGAVPNDVLDQFVRRDREVLLPAGLRWLVAFVEGRAAGIASLLSLEGVGYVDNVVTHPRFRRRGVATSTVMSAVKGSAGSGDRLVHLLAEQGGSPQRLYERLGFRIRAETSGFTRPLP